MKKLIKGYFSAVVLLLTLITIPVFAAGTNGSFENGTTNPGSYLTLNTPNTTDISDWSVNSGSIDYIGNYWQAQDGSRSIDLNGLAQGSISQIITTINGATYDVNFYLSGNPDSRAADDNLYSPSLKELSVSATGALSQNFTYDTVAKGNSLANMKWEQESYSFIATGTSTTLTFASAISGAFGPAIDNVVITETLPVSTIPVYTGRNSCSEGKTPVLLSNLTQTIDSKLTNPVTVTLPTAGEYLFETVGDYGYGGDSANNAMNRADAGYATGDNWLNRLDSILGIAPSATYRGVTSLISDMGTGIMGIVDWGNYNSSHNYKFNYTTTSTNAKFIISDWWDSWYLGGINNNQGGVWDNAGNLTLNVYSCEVLPPQCNENATENIVSDTTNMVNGSFPAVATYVHPAWTNISGATWIWSENQVSDPTNEHTNIFTKTFNITGSVLSGGIDIAADNGYLLKINGNTVDDKLTVENNYSPVKTYDVSTFLQSGANTLEITVKNFALAGSTYDTNPAGLLYKLTVNNNECATPAPTGSLTVTKNTIGGDGIEEFNFTGIGSGFNIATTNNTGSRTLSNLAPGSYSIEETVPTGWNLTSNGCKNITVVAGQMTTCTIENTKQSSISGMKYNDLNHNGKLDFGEPGLEGWVIKLFLDDPLTDKDTLIASTTTDGSGNYTFSNITPGTYDVREVHQKGWKRTSKNPKDIVITSGNSVGGINFGNAQKKKCENEDTDKDDNRDDQSGHFYCNNGNCNYENDQNKPEHSLPPQNNNGHGKNK